MPTRHVSAEMMTVGGHAGGKHWTEAEVSARKQAEDGLKRKGPVRLRAPEWLGDEARKVWQRVKRQAAGLELLDPLDGDMLAIYCDAVVQYRKAVKLLAAGMADDKPVDVDEVTKAAQSWARLVAAYADKLGLSRSARARLAKKKADEILDSFGSEFDG